MFALLFSAFQLGQFQPYAICLRTSAVGLTATNAA